MSATTKPLTYECNNKNFNISVQQQELLHMSAATITLTYECSNKNFNI